MGREDDEEQQRMPFMPAQEDVYGTGSEILALKVRRRKHDFPLIFAALVLLMPWGLFVAVYAAMSLSLHYSNPGVSWFIFALGVVLVLTCAYMAFSGSQLRGSRDPAWYLVLTSMMLLALVLSTVLGYVNFQHNFWEYYQILDMQVHKDVDPVHASGRFLTDAGLISFAPGVALNVDMAGGFRNHHMYCATPIGASPASGEYRFWAVGIDCCSSMHGDFHCGDYKTPSARMGVRVLQQEEVAYYHLAVEKAESTFGIRAPNPIFFKWVVDSHVYLENRRSTGQHYFTIGAWVHLGLQAFLLAVAWRYYLAPKRM